MSSVRVLVDGVRLPRDQIAESRRDLLRPLIGGVLVDQSGAHAAVPHPVHQLTSRGAGHGRQVV
ncbi:MAG TPA: hypothetical protein VFK66_14975, partial [Oryzihumus sp.]|nr:hypothetical protein [Oryzihumus sp.]